MNYKSLIKIVIIIVLILNVSCLSEITREESASDISSEYSKSYEESKADSSYSFGDSSFHEISDSDSKSNEIALPSLTPESGKTPTSKAPVTTVPSSAPTNASTPSPASTIAPSPTINASPTPTRKPEIPPNKDREVGIWYSTWYSKLDPSTPGYTLTYPNGHANPQFNIWLAWDIPYLPLGPSGKFETYDSLDEEVLLFHIDEMTKAGIDFILMDQTNHIDVDGGFINARSIKMAQTIKKWNDNPNNSNRQLRYSSAIGEFQFTGDPASIEKEAGILFDRYLSQDFGSPKYHYYLYGKPLLVVYAGNRDISLWQNYTGSKEYANKFTLRWANNDSVAGFYGWAYDGGTKYHREVMVVMPGWRNAHGGFVFRAGGDWYRDSWAQVLNAAEKPRIVMINSFNEYAERTALWKADTSLLPSEDIWYTRDSYMLIFGNLVLRSSGNRTIDPNMYWNMTIDFINQYKGE